MFFDIPTARVLRIGAAGVEEPGAAGASASDLDPAV